MAEPQFHNTAMGQKFYEKTMPELVRQLSRLTDLLARLVSQNEDSPDVADR